MGNCLVTRLKGVVDNDNLPKYNTIRFKVEMPEVSSDSAAVSYMYANLLGSTLTSVTGEPFDICDANGNITTSNVTTYTNVGWANIKPRLGKTYIFELTGRYTVGGFGSSSKDINKNMTIDVGDFCWSKDITEITVGLTTDRCANITGTFKLPEGKLLQKFNAQKCDVYVNIDDFALLTTLLVCNLYGNTLAEGSIYSLENNVGLTELKLVSNRKITGDIKTLADTLVTKGRTSGHLVIMGWNSNLTIDGVPYDTAVKAAGENYWSVRIEFDSSVPGGYTLSYF
jgi:hypothetical protein